MSNMPRSPGINNLNRNSPSQKPEQLQEVRSHQNYIGLPIVAERQHAYTHFNRIHLLPYSSHLATPKPEKSYLPQAARKVKSSAREFRSLLGAPGVPKIPMWCALKWLGAGFKATG